MNKIISDLILESAVKKYYASIKQLFVSNNAETQNYKHIADLLEAFGCKVVDLSCVRSGSSGKNADLYVYHLDDVIGGISPFACVEVKKIGGKANQSQIEAEVTSSGNLIFTDNLSWCFYTNQSITIDNEIQLISQTGDALILNNDKISLFIEAVKNFLLVAPTNINSASQLAKYMASFAKNIRAIIRDIFSNESTPMYSSIYALYSKLEKELLPELNSNDFSDMYAQTIVYGLFIARYNERASTNFNSDMAIRNLSNESELLKQFFMHITMQRNLHTSLKNTIDELCKLYRLADISNLLDKEDQRDPIINFYEQFLSFYDPIQRKSLGAYYTPVQVVRYMIDMVDEILLDDFKISRGLANNDATSMTIKTESGKDTITVSKVSILDPATGTGTFMSEIIKYVRQKYFSGNNSVFYKSWIQAQNSLLSRLIGFEIMMTSYVVARLKMRRTIAETMCEIPDEMIPTNIFLTNTLIELKTQIKKNRQFDFLDFSGAITDEAQNADNWKRFFPIKVIIGNPPYNKSSKNVFDISAYKTEVNGETRLQEKNPKSLNDDYVKFIRFAEEHIKRNGNGILAFITNNGYFNNITFRGMRSSLLRTFDKIYILNLHGNATKAETCPDGSKDENIFNIKTGVGIIIGVKTSQSSEWGKVLFSEIHGLRTEKFSILDSKGIEYKEISIDRESASFIPRYLAGKELYSFGVPLNNLFQSTVSGIVTGNEEVAIASTREELRHRIKIVENDTNGEATTKLFGRFGSGQTALSIQEDVAKSNGKITQITCRPFDDRWTYYSGISSGWICRPRKKESMGQLLEESDCPIGRNIGFVFSRGGVTKHPFPMVLIVDKVVNCRLVSIQTEGAAYVAPLYRFEKELQYGEWKPNISTQYFEQLTANLSLSPKPLELLDYCYGVLFDPNYLRRYKEFLEQDFPKVPIIKDKEQFEKYVSIGEKLRKLHLFLTDVKLDLIIVGSDLKITATAYIDEELFINKTTKITGIPFDVYNYCICGHQVIDKWFKSHKEQSLDFDKFNHIKTVAAILSETILIQETLSNCSNF
ncbi:MAG: N-6 DNA methylase [Christensenellaceae bacterium]|jgi:predicted helicase|nr:N-6 DNA methylase [Christensenellaceae bacterium]